MPQFSLVAMPYCNRCGYLFPGRGRYCQIHKTSTPRSPPVRPPQELVRQSDRQVGSLWASQAIARMADDPNFSCSIDAITFDGQKTTVYMNNDRVQCPCCEEWFARPARLDQHYGDFPSGCCVHGLCFERSENVVHAMRYKHHRCFVPSCRSRYRTDQGWSDSAIVAHVRRNHSN